MRLTGRVGSLAASLSDLAVEIEGVDLEQRGARGDRRSSGASRRRCTCVAPARRGAARTSPTSPTSTIPFPFPTLSGVGRSARSRIRSRASASSTSSPRITPRSTTGAGLGERGAGPRTARRPGTTPRATSSVASSRPVTYVVSTRVDKGLGRCSSSTPTRGSSSIRIPTGATRRSTVSRARARRHGRLQGRVPRLVRPASEPAALPADRGGVSAGLAGGSGARRLDGRGAAAAPRAGHLGRADPLGRGRGGTAVSARAVST